MFSNLLLSAAGPKPKLYLCCVCLAAVSLIQEKEIKNNVNINNYVLHVIKHMSPLEPNSPLEKSVGL